MKVQRKESPLNQQQRRLLEITCQTYLVFLFVLLFFVVFFVKSVISRIQSIQYIGYRKTIVIFSD